MSAHHPTLDYYDRNADAFRKRTADCAVSHLYDAFLSLLPAGAHILDAGCGPGRDAVVFLKQGFSVTAFDPSATMVEIATQSTGQPALLLSVQEMEFDDAFDGVWACASLLHVPKSQIDDVLERIARSLKAGGVFFMSVKHGNGERIDGDGRLFCDYTVESLKAQLNRQHALEILNVADAPPGEINRQHWVWAIARKLRG